jgi:hypothetical protein
MPGITALGFLILLAAWASVTGIMEVVAVSRSKRPAFRRLVPPNHDKIPAEWDQKCDGLLAPLLIKSERANRFIQHLVFSKDLSLNNCLYALR